ncbi:vWA domain-containing protein [Chroococcidiopsis sp. CCMEE 29]|uniref:vWA domain-containing protein n=1 Tax=Chroococcidiopsis sp. CCMEE 29 TaxID=155894 RepID=UPI002020E2A7|nr:vWA domain-containing protein [Chroococcidiopsis sp. CCMEE 29]
MIRKFLVIIHQLLIRHGFQYSVIHLLLLSFSVIPQKVTPGQQLSSEQKLGLELVTRLHSGRDVVLAIDLTESVGINHEGRIRLRQIIEDSLKPGDSVYVVPFGSDVSSLQRASILYPLGTSIEFSNKNKENFNKVLQKVPLSANLKLQNTDIQQAEVTIYQGLAQLNQNRLQQNQPIKPQSVVWITDAPLLANSGNDWIETPANSPFRVKDSPESKERQAWLMALPMNKKELLIQNAQSKNYKLAVVDIAPTVQEFCTIAPGNKELCKVNPYLFGQLWLPTSILSIVLALVPFFLWHLIKLRKKWRIIVTSELNEDQKECRPLLPGKSFAIGEADSKCIDEIACPGSEVRAYLERRGNQIYLVPTKLAPIQWNGKEVNKRTRLTGNPIKLNCPDERSDNFYIKIKIRK